MNITKQDIDALNAVISVEIEQDDYRQKVDKILKDYRKTAHVPGFRKGHVPMGRKIRFVRQPASQARR